MMHTAKFFLYDILACIVKKQVPEVYIDFRYFKCNNTFKENNINFISTGNNWIARNNIFNTSYELNYFLGIGFNVGIADTSKNNQFIGNHIYHSAENGIVILNAEGR